MRLRRRDVLAIAERAERSLAASTEMALRDCGATYDGEEWRADAARNDVDRHAAACQLLGWRTAQLRALIAELRELAGAGAAPLSLADVKAALAEGASERAAAERTLKRSPRR